MPVETPLYFAQVIQDHLHLKEQNAELERAMPLDRYKGGDPFNNHPLFKTEEQARQEETMENVAVQAHMLMPTTVPSAAEDLEFPVEVDADPGGEERLWSRSRDFDWGD